jgi:hypothetical protein
LSLFPPTQKEIKLWRVALDKAAPDGEAHNAAVALDRSWRERGVDWRTLETQIAALDPEREDQIRARGYRTGYTDCEINHAASGQGGLNRQQEEQIRGEGYEAGIIDGVQRIKDRALALAFVVAASGVAWLLWWPHAPQVQRATLVKRPAQIGAAHHTKHHHTRAVAQKSIPELWN